MKFWDTFFTIAATMLCTAVLTFLLISPRKTLQPIITHEEIASEMRKIINGYYPTVWEVDGNNKQRELGPRYGAGSSVEGPEIAPLTIDQQWFRLIELVESRRR
jgi:hypothetical protein